jgi:uncharacterized membrane protein YfcA
LAWYLFPAVIAAGFTAGFINTLAGSGSLVTLPLLIFLGLPATVANGTNRVAIVMQNIVAGTSFQRQGVLDLPGSLRLAVPAILGAVVGAQIAVNLDERAMERAIGGLMFFMLVVILVQPKRWLRGRLERLQGWPNWWQFGLMFLIGIYGGFIQAGVGIFLLAGLVLGIGYDLVKANAVKIAIVFFFTLSALFVFIFNGQVIWGIGLLLGIGNMMGAWVGTKFAVEKGALWVRRLLIAVVLVSGAELLGLFDLIFQSISGGG